MIACVCRNIKDSDYSTQQDLEKRIMQSDARCKVCQRYYQKKTD